MKLQRGLLVVRLVAERTRKRFLPGVNQLVPLRVVDARERLAAVPTLVGLGAAVDAPVT